MLGVAGRVRGRSRTIALAVGAAILLLLVVAGLAFANSLSVTRVTNNARSLHWANATIGTSALVRAGLVQAVTFAELSRQRDVVTEEDFDFAMDQVVAATGELDQLLDAAGGHDSRDSLAAFLTPVHTTVEALEAGEIAAAKDLVRNEVETAYTVLSDSLDAEQAHVQSLIDDNSADGKALNGWIVFFLTLAVPGSAVAAYFVTARRQMRAVRERSRLEIEAEREIGRAKDSFIAGLSHELRTPLTSIYGFAEVLTDGGVQGVEATKETAQIIANEAAEMTRMVDDLLAASRLESTGIEIELVPTRIEDVIVAAAAPFERAGIGIMRKPTAAMANVDAARLRHILVNLLSNAARHGGPVIGVEVNQGEDDVDIEVWDNGRGVPDDQVATLFQRFVHDGQASLLAGSVGLGLAVASRLTALMGGVLKYQRFGDVTYFIVTLPSGPIASEDEGEEASVTVDLITEKAHSS